MRLLIGSVHFCPQDRRYADLTEEELPSCESLKDTIARALPYWNNVIAPQIKQGKRVLIAAHGNSLRGIVKHLEGARHSRISKTSEISDEIHILVHMLVINLLVLMEKSRNGLNCYNLRCLV